MEYFAYYFIMPDKEDFRQIRVYMEDNELKIKKTSGVLEAEHIIRNVQFATTTKYRFVNTAIK